MNRQCGIQENKIPCHGSNGPDWVYHCGASIISIDTSANCESIAVGCVDKTLRLFSRQGNLIWERILDEEVWCVSFADIARFVVAGTAKKSPPFGSVYIFNNSGHELLKYSIDSPVWSVSTSDDARVVVASSWNNFAYRFEFIDTEYKLTNKGRFGDYGLYGIKTTQDGLTTILAASENGLFVLDKNLKPISGRKIKLKNGLYNIDTNHDGTKILVGCRDGKFFYIDNSKSIDGNYSTTLSDRPICGVALTNDGYVASVGSFDGKLYLTTNKGRRLWEYQTNGEVWTTSISKDGANVCIGSGDQCLYFFKNPCSSSVMKELEDIESFLSFIKSRNKLRKELKKALEIYFGYGLIEYGIKRSRELLNEKIHAADLEGIIYDILEKSVLEYPQCYKYHRMFAVQAEKIGKYNTAIHHNQIAANNNELSFSSMISSATNFQKLGLTSAARSCFRRAIAQSMDYSSMNVLYNLARSYEDTENWSEASTIYEVLISWDIQFRNAMERLNDIKQRITKERDIDYTGVTVNLMGVDSPRQYNISEKLSHITKSRSKELHFDELQKRKLFKVFQKLENNYKLPLALQRNKALEYDDIAYLKYDYLPPEDEIKKQLEMVYELLVLEGRRNINRTLDIGAATGRHPMLLTQKGKKAYGIDIEKRAMIYADRIKKQSRKASEYPYYCVGNSIYLPFSNTLFDLVTCMMGTFSHIDPNENIEMLKESYRVLNTNGVIILSTWDIECQHLSFLSIYSEDEKRAITGNSITKYETRLLLEQVGFKNVTIIPFMMVPNVFIYELDLHHLELKDLKRAVEIDMAAKSLYPTMSGEMFMAVGIK